MTLVLTAEVVTYCATINKLLITGKSATTSVVGCTRLVLYSWPSVGRLPGAYNECHKDSHSVQTIPACAVLHCLLANAD